MSDEVLEQFEDDVRSMVFEVLMDSDERVWLLASDRLGAGHAREYWDKRVAEEGAEVREVLEEEGVPVHEFSDVSLGWLTILVDFMGDEYTVRQIVVRWRMQSELSDEDLTQTSEMEVTKRRDRTPGGRPGAPLLWAGGGVPTFFRRP